MKINSVDDFYKELNLPRKIKRIIDENIVVKTSGTEYMIIIFIFFIVFLGVISFINSVTNEPMPKMITLIVESISFFLIALAVIVFIFSKQEISFENNKIIYKNKRGMKKTVNLEDNPIVYVKKYDYYVDYSQTSAYYLYIETDNEIIKIRILVSHKKLLCKLLNNLELE